MTSVLPRPTVAGMASPRTQARKRCLLVAYLAGMVCLAIGSSALAIFIFKRSVEHKFRHGGQNDSSIELVRRQFQGGGVIGDIPFDPLSSNFIPSTTGLPDVSALGGPDLPIDPQASNIDGIVEGASETVGSIFGNAIPTPPQSPAPGLPQFSITPPSLASPLATPLDGELNTDGLADQLSGLNGGPGSLLTPSLQATPLPSSELSISLSSTPTNPTDISAPVLLSPGAVPQQSASEGVGLGEILSNDGTTNVDSAALLSGLSNIVDQISGFDPESASDLTVAVVDALPAYIPGAAGVLPGALDAIESGSSERLDSVIPTIGGAIGEDVIPVNPIEPSDASGALGNVVNRGKTIVNQITEAMGDNIDPALQEVVDNVSKIVDSAEQQLEEPLCLVNQVVNEVTDQVLVPCTEAEPGAPTTIAHLAPTQATSPALSEGTGLEDQSDSSSQQSASEDGSTEAPSEDTPDIDESSPPSQSLPGSGPAISQSPDLSSWGNPQTGQNIPQGQGLPSSPQDSSDGGSSSPSAGSQEPSQDGDNDEEVQPSSSQSAGGTDQGSQSEGQPTSPNTSPDSSGGSQESSGDQNSSPGQPWIPSADGVQNSAGEEPANQKPGSDDGSSATDFPGSGPSGSGSSGTGSSGSGFSAPDSGSSPATPTTSQSSTNGADFSAANEGCPICPQCMPQSCDGDYSFDSDQSPCDGRGFECDECLHGWFCPPRETPAQAAPCGLGWPCYHCTDGWFCLPNEDESPDFVISSSASGVVEHQPPAYDDPASIKRPSSNREERDGGVNDYYYIGCFQDATSRTLLGNVPVDYLSGRMSTGICTNHCFERGYTFAGTENGHECWCGETMRPDARKLPDSSCQTSCHGNQDSVCGGNMVISIFADADEYQELVGFPRR